MASTVGAYDPSPEAEAKFLGLVARARAQLAELGLTGAGEIRFSTDLAQALDGAQFVQENGPENEAVKRALLAQIDALRRRPTRSSPAAPRRWSAAPSSPIACGRAHHRRPSRSTRPISCRWSRSSARMPTWSARPAAYYRAQGRRPVVLNREMPGHIANRLASALYREAVYLVEQGVASVADIDAALCNGPGLRWALMGPHMTYHLGGGEGGIAGYLAHLGPSQLRRWESLGKPALGAGACRRDRRRRRRGSRRPLASRSWRRAATKGCWRC